MAEAARKRRHEYFSVTDHFKTAHYASGLSIEEIAAQHFEIDPLNKRSGGCAPREDGRLLNSGRSPAPVRRRGLA